MKVDKRGPGGGDARLTGGKLLGTMVATAGMNASCMF